ncbi:hypothetical protein BCC1697_004589 [Burkholderia gladioli]
MKHTTIRVYLNMTISYCYPLKQGILKLRLTQSDTD